MYVFVCVSMRLYVSLCARVMRFGDGGFAGSHHLRDGCKNCGEHFCYACLSTASENLAARGETWRCKCEWQRERSEWHSWNSLCLPLQSTSEIEKFLVFFLFNLSFLLSLPPYIRLSLFVMFPLFSYRSLHIPFLSFSSLSYLFSPFPFASLSLFPSFLSFFSELYVGDRQISA